MFNEVFHFIQPKNNQRYQDKLEFIDVHFMLSKASGTSGDALIKYHYINNVSRDTYSLSILISTKIKSGNLTPAHELLHAYQNGYTFFKNRWFTEGTARWVEYAFKPGTGEQKMLPRNHSTLEQLLAKTYDAKYFWNRIVSLCSKAPVKLTIPVILSQAKYIGSSEYVIKGNELYGHDFILSLFQKLQQFDDQSAHDRGLDRNHWKESEQKSVENNKYILMALKEAINSMGCGELDEVATFLVVVDNYIKKAPVFKVGSLSEKVENLGNPYQNYYKEGEHIYSRNIWDMQFYNNELFFGAGNASNSPPSLNAGPVPIISYNPEKQIFSIEGMVNDEQIDRYKILNGQLYIPGFDARENHKWGNFYRRGLDSHWDKKRTIPKGLHVFDMAYFDNKLVGGILSSKGAAVVVSEDDGETWSTTQLGARQRVYDLFKIKGKLFAVKQFLSLSSIDKLPDAAERDHYFTVAQWHDNKFEMRPDLNRDVFFPGISLNKKRTLRISRTIQLDNQVVYLGAYNYNVPFGFFIASSLDRNQIEIQHIKLTPDFKPRDMLHRNGVLYLLCSQKTKDGFRVIVFKTMTDSLTKLEQIINFSSAVFARSFEELDGDFYFGMGGDVRNKKIWKQEELKPETGDILRVHSGYIQK